MLLLLAFLLCVGRFVTSATPTPLWTSFRVHHHLLLFLLILLLLLLVVVVVVVIEVGRLQVAAAIGSLASVEVHGAGDNAGVKNVKELLNLFFLILIVVVIFLVIVTSCLGFFLRHLFKHVKKGIPWNSEGLRLGAFATLATQLLCDRLYRHVLARLPRGRSANDLHAIVVMLDAQHKRLLLEEIIGSKHKNNGKAAITTIQHSRSYVFQMIEDFFIVFFNQGIGEHMTAQYAKPKSRNTHDGLVSFRLRNLDVYLTLMFAGKSLCDLLIRGFSGAGDDLLTVIVEGRVQLVVLAAQCRLLFLKILAKLFVLFMVVQKNLCTLLDAFRKLAHKLCGVVRVEVLMKRRGDVNIIVVLNCHIPPNRHFRIVKNFTCFYTLHVYPMTQNMCEKNSRRGQKRQSENKQTNKQKDRPS
ncbi:hypothetical protein ECC02_003125 [Trypanosoma cruzi]|uniref:Uncharacterized protein n=1 Tax=Trypanosoma cruzi TaxID=5693 RepID=A0A7J6YA98_TRYCR|nr:hypothetical protein ECC02_003125 [Trypanosoma cruzi]